MSSNRGGNGALAPNHHYNVGKVGGLAEGRIISLLGGGSIDRILCVNDDVSHVMVGITQDVDKVEALLHVMGHALREDV